MPLSQIQQYSKLASVHVNFKWCGFFLLISWKISSNTHIFPVIIIHWLHLNHNPCLLVSELTNKSVDHPRNNHPILLKTVRWPLKLTRTQCWVRCCNAVSRYTSQMHYLIIWIWLWTKYLGRVYCSTVSVPSKETTTFGHWRHPKPLPLHLCLPFHLSQHVSLLHLVRRPPRRVIVGNDPINDQ